MRGRPSGRFAYFYRRMSRRPKILVIRFSSIGDIVLTTPVFRVLKKRIEPAPELHFLTKKSYASVLEGNPYIDRIHSIEKSTAELDEVLRGHDFDYVVDLHRNLRSAMVKRSLKVVDFTVEKRNFDKWLLVRFGSRRKEIPHITDRYLACLKPFGKEISEGDGKGLDFFIPDSERSAAAALFPNVNQHDVALALGATHDGKRMPYKLLSDLIQGSQQRFILLGGKEDLGTAEALKRAFGDRVLHACGELSLHASAALAERCGKLISGDTGMMHIGAALGIPVISVWGCTSPELGMAPYRPHPSSVVIEPVDRSKRPCSKLGDRCKYGKENRCISAIRAEQILTVLQGL